MKKLFSIISAGLLVALAVSCVKEELVTFDPATSTAPKLLNYTIDEKAITANYVEGSFSQDFNTEMKANHTLAIVKVQDQTYSKTLSVSGKEGTVKISVGDLSKALISLGYAEGNHVSVELAIRATMQDISKDTGINGYVDSEDHIAIPSFEIYIPVVVGSPYKDYNEKSEWGLIGSMAAYEISWDKDLCMWTDGNGNHVAAHVTLKAGDEVKFRKDQAWTVNFGGEFSALDSSFAVSQDGPNIKISTDGIYDLFLSEDGTAIVSEAFDPIPNYKEASNWGVTGSIAAHGISWDKDIAMLTDGANHVALSVTLGADDEFKFRADGGWAVNMGGEFGGLDSEFAVTQDGPNIKVGAAGVYDLYVNPDAGTAKVTEAAGMKISTIIGADDPGEDPQPVEVTGWNIIGLNGDWENDVLASESNGVWTAFITAEDATEFKWRKDGGWDENYGGTMVAFGEPFAAEAGGANIAVEAGFYKVVLDLTDEAAPTITVYNDFEVYSLIGDFNSWGGDVDLVETEPGIWVSPATALTTGGFKIRSGHDWSLSWGGTLEELGVAFDAVSDNGPNIVVPEDAEYIVTFDKPNLKITVEAALPSNTWSLIGVNGDWSNDIFMIEVMPGVWVSPEIETTTDWKVRFNHGWDVNSGGATPSAEGEFVKAVPGGSNIGITGKFKVVYNTNNETIGTLVWGVVGSVAAIDGFNWNNDIPMNLASDGKWYSIPVTLADGDQIKIRKYADWAENFGGTFAEADAPFEAVAGGDNIKAAGTYMVVYDPAAGTLELSTHFWGLIGDFNGWAADKFMLYDGAKWCAYGQSLAGGWKIREAAGWDNNRGGVFAAAGEAFEAVAGGDNINVGDLEGFDVIYDPAAETITVAQ